MIQNLDLSVVQCFQIELIHLLSHNRVRAKSKSESIDEALKSMLKKVFNCHDFVFSIKKQTLNYTSIVLGR